MIKAIKLTELKTATTLAIRRTNGRRMMIAVNVMKGSKIGNVGKTSKYVTNVELTIHASVRVDEVDRHMQPSAMTIFPAISATINTTIDKNRRIAVDDTHFVGLCTLCTNMYRARPQQYSVFVEHILLGMRLIGR
mmetsp:Transcript_2630/g.4043  ORF Transcript_2630/g.4043 Transcript_2630/m.4043 type:complete len:135 (+) Transcript_2630:183-587(+)